ncbi:hypothetical protein FLJC2902T_03220 [Flavobacterium limnosediminis JC2902]|uniref:DUF2891 domain-containing protein n=1 Tax=Flavobacterium limnosediminis JC2902 TaxID=1341181 RepID=V6STR3_9FLAO|nr:DUF2891 domain-containing protein [Flavobacterium limnosediminis]ESU29844.1 hypothetical protein FLJC2902T_03220 [Flavobacterium limnosediminis JC2902]
MRYLFFFLFSVTNFFAQQQLTEETALKLSQLPLHCINTEFPNKTSHLSDSEKDAVLLPHELHPVFYGCLDWHSSVHGHWMLVKLLKTFPNLKNKDSIIAVLDNSFQKEKMILEANYFGKYTASSIFERTYGWAWLLKLDEELYTWNTPQGKKWHEALQPLTAKIVQFWKAYLPKETYPNRTGVHPNTAFGLCFAYDWAKATNDKIFLEQITQKGKGFYFSNSKIPAYLEPDGSDFFSPSLQVADLMTRLLPRDEFLKWFKHYFTKDGLKRICTLPTVSDRSDYHIVHLDGLSFSRAWNMKNIAKQLPKNNATSKHFKQTADAFITKSLPVLFESGYGGGHWLASFAIYALTLE